MGTVNEPRDDRAAALAVIIGRAGSAGLPGKNAMVVAGRPMVAHTIDDARRARCVERIVVSTDCPRVARAARDDGVEVIERPPHLATADAPVDAAVRHAVAACDDRASIIVILYANVPVRPNDLIDRAVAQLVATGADSVQSYQPVGKHHPFWMVRLAEDGRVAPFDTSAPTVDRRQDLPPLLLPDGGVIAVRRASLLAAEPSGDPHAFLGRDRRGIETPPGGVVDVDDEIDARLAAAILSAKVLEVAPCT